jgi:subtilisin-like proprotein convertase family protein
MRTLHTFAFIIGCLLSLHASCDKLRSVAIADTTQTSATITWKDNNANITGYQLAYNFKGMLLKDAIKLPLVATKSATLTDLDSGTAYLFWIRTICATNDTSKWEGPFPLITVLSNPSRCTLSLELTDNSCNSPRGGDEFSIDVENVVTGQNVYLESVSLIISHTWPADLTLKIENPQGQSILLSKENGTLTDDFGILNDSCNRPCIFSAFACKSIKGGSPPFEGNFEPEEPLQTLFTTNPNGKWKLKICDGAINDKGILRYISLKFSPIQCKPVDQYFVSKVTDKTFDVLWVRPNNCNLIEVHYYKKGEANNEKKEVGLCSNGKVTINNLSPDTEYDYYLVSDCSPSKSSPTCIRTIKTLCKPVVVSENFDQLTPCDVGCNIPCSIAGTFYNSENDDLDWILNEGSTPSEFTGPENGLYEGGKYIYMESNPTLCGENKSAILESKCMKAKGSNSSCDLSFFYHMYGKDIGQLSVKKSINNGNNWLPLFDTAGDQGKEWRNAQLDLGLNKDQLFKLRFESKTTNGVEGDIALDQFNIANAILVVESIFYADKDGDGYGVNDDTVRLCLTVPPNGYAMLKGDCNDNEGSVNPGKTDIPCNLVDENCDGKLELKDVLNPMSIVSATIVDETCKGKKDGKIKLDLTGGTLPYSFKWNNLPGNDSLINLNNGFYVCKITDANGCGVESTIFEIKTKSNFDIFVESIKKPSCKGVANGEIKINHNGAFPPFSFSWSNGSTTKNITNIKDGVYKVTVKDDLGCQSESQNIVVSASSTLNAVNSFVKHPLCYGDSTGILDFDVIVGIPPFSYIWKDSFALKRRDKLPDGAYGVTISDAQNCLTELIGVIKQPPRIEVLITNIEEVRCNGNATGQIKLKISGGVQPYDFQWSDAYLLQNRNNIKAGNYHVTVSDNNGCKDSVKNIIIKQSPPLSYMVDTLVNASCLKKADGFIQTTIFGGLPPYTYYWTNGLSQNNKNDHLLPMDYTLTVVDNYNCKLTTNAIQIQNKNLAYPIDIAIVNNTVCPNEYKGSVAVQCLQAQPPLDFNWSAGIQNKKNALSDTISNLSSGFYTVTITDNESCVSTSNAVEIIKIPEFNTLIETKSNVCNTSQEGEIAAKMNGGTPPYKYLWSNGEKNDTIRNLKNAIYSFKATDAKGCSFESQPIIITSASDIKVGYISMPTHQGKNEGSISVSASGGLGNYTIVWENPILMGLMPKALKEGLYRFTLTDELNCSIDTFAIVDIVNGVEDLHLSKIKAYPNPVVNKAFLSAVSSIADVRIKTITGTEVYPMISRMHNALFEIDFGNLACGIYIAEIVFADHLSAKVLLYKL